MDLVQSSSFNGSEIAIIGMSCRFPGAPNVEEFWHNLSNGVESISRFEAQELIDAGVDINLVNHPDYVKANSILSDVDCFDAFFFDTSAKEAERMDPQQRLFLEQAWETLENAGYSSDNYSGAIGVYAGSSTNTYLLNNLYPTVDTSDSASVFQLMVGGNKDFLPTRTSYHLNLKGPSVNVQTACSTSLVATHLACQSLLNGECDMALAGGVTVRVPQITGYLYQEGLVLSPDGHCRAFDADAKGAIGGNGVGLVLLKRLEDALADGDYIRAVIKGSAVNNDGSLKVGFTAPGVDGQANVIKEAQAIAQTDPETIGYVEAHGSGTHLGDPIEIAAMTQAFAGCLQEDQPCAIGSVKTNIGHLDVAAGVAGLIKTTLALEHKAIPPSLHFKQPNPHIDFASGNFKVNAQLLEWPTNGVPRRAGVNSFGIGGTNAHVVLEEAPLMETSSSSRPWQLIVLSAKTSSTLETMTDNFTDFLKQNPDVNLADATYTLQVGRRVFDYRRMVLCRDVEDALSAFQTPQRTYSNVTDNNQGDEATIAFMFTGLGSQYVNMGWDLYQSEVAFREQIDRCCDYLKPLLKLDLRDVTYPNRHQGVDTSKDSEPISTSSSSQSGINLRQMLGRGNEKPDEATQTLNQTYLTQPAVFVIEYALASLWQSWGISPTAMIGYSIGEYVAACLSGVLSLEEALTLVAKRAQLIQDLPNGAMLAVPLPEQEVHTLLNEKISLSAVNGSSACVVAGDIEAIDALAEKLMSQGIACRRLATSHAFHSHMMESIVPSFTKILGNIKLKTPKIPYISNLTGNWITAEQATDPHYWVQHLCQPVRFADGVTVLNQQGHSVLLEVGPGQTLNSLALQCLGAQKNQADILSSLRHVYDQQSDTAFLLNNLGQLWLSGIEIDWTSFYSNERRHRLPLPTYPFERQRYWVEPQSLSSHQSLLSPSERWALLVQAGQIQANSGLSTVDESAHVVNKQALDQLCIAYINMAFRQLGTFTDSESRYTLADLVEQSQTIPRYHQLLERWLAILLESGQLEQKDNYFTHLSPCSMNTVQNYLTDVKAKWAKNLNFVELVESCGENLATVLTGQKEPWDILSKLVNQIQDEYNLELPEVYYYKLIIRAILAQLPKTLPPQTELKILEVGGGAGITTAELLPILPPKQTSYTFTDVGRLFLTQAQEKFKDYSFVEYDFLDIDQPAQEQGYSLHHFDVVIGSNVLHVARNLDSALENVRSLLAPGGLLVIWEFTQPQLNFDIADALLMNPVDENDSDRNMGNPFVSKEQWQAALKRHGFIEVEAFSATDVFGQHIFIAQAGSLGTSDTLDAFTTTSAATVENAFNPLGRKPNMDDWFYIPAWTRSELLRPAIAAKSAVDLECWLVFADDYGLGDQFGQALQATGHDVVIVKIGNDFDCSQTIASNGKHHYTYTIDPEKLQDYSSLFQALQQANLKPTQVLHLWSINSSEQQLKYAIDNFQSVQHLGLYSLMCIAQVMGKQNPSSHPLHLTVISNQVQLVTGNEELQPAQAPLLAAIRVIPQEYEDVDCRIIDIDLPKNNQPIVEERVSQLLKEITTSSTETIVAYRGQNRWLPIFKETPLKGTDDGQTRFKHHGVYLITGGLGYLGSLIAEHLAKTVQAKLILTGRSALPAREEWAEWLAAHDDKDNSTSRKIRQIQSLEALGAEVLVTPVDVANLQQMQTSIVQAEQVFGPINGVIHAAGLNASEGGLSPIEAGVNLDRFEQNFQPKVYGTWVLNEIFQDKDLDFCLLMSSLSSVLGGKGTIDYTAAMFFVDTFTHWHNQQSSVPWITTNWGFWKVGEEEVSRQFLAENWGELGLIPQEGIEALERILLWENLNQVLISPGSLKEMINEWGSPGSPKEDTSQSINTTVTRHTRPNLKNAYVAPETELETKLADIFQTILGFESIGIHDNFFYLGGDSLVGIKLISQINEVFEVDLSLRLLFEAPSIAELELLIEKMIIEELESLTEDEVKSAL
ncbi:MAG: SDR family NAD(P)-dependent oxidoreductase [Cyanobacteria bacterium P01_F01_bin.116]